MLDPHGVGSWKASHRVEYEPWEKEKMKLIIIAILLVYMYLSNLRIIIQRNFT